MKVLAGGRFNILHPGHLFFLGQARSLGDELVVVVASDRTVRNEGKLLLFPAAERKKMVRSLACVDKAVVGYDLAGQGGYLRIIRKERPDIIALGHDQTVDGARLKAQATAAGLRVKVVRIGKYKNYATSMIMKELRNKK